MACPNRMPIADACDAPTNVPTGSNPHLLKLALFFHPERALLGDDSGEYVLLRVDIHFAIDVAHVLSLIHI